MNRLHKIQNVKIREFIRFSLVGTLCAIIHYVVYLVALLILGMELSTRYGISWQANIAYFIGYSLSLIVNLFLSSTYTFKQNISIKRTILFVLCHILNYILHSILFNLYLWIGISNYLILPFVLLITVPVNFLLVRKTFHTL